MSPLKRPCLTTWKIKILKLKKTPGDIIILHMCTINDIWGMDPKIWSVTNRIFLSFWTVFCPFTPLWTQKIKILKKWKKHLEISSFYKRVPKIMIICYTVPEICHVTDHGRIQRFFGDTVFLNGNFSLKTPWLPGGERIKSF